MSPDFCKYSCDCGFHKYLSKQGLINTNGQCGKKAKKECSRYILASITLGDTNAEAINKINNIYKTTDLFTLELPATYEELEITSSRSNITREKGL